MKGEGDGHLQVKECTKERQEHITPGNMRMCSAAVSLVSSKAIVSVIIYKALFVEMFFAHRGDAMEYPEGTCAECRIDTTARRIFTQLVTAVLPATK